VGNGRGVSRALSGRALEEAHEIDALARGRAPDKLETDAGDQAARGLTIIAGVVEVARDGGARRQPLVPRAQRGE